ncbi:MAG: hypothetical protein PHY48_02605 [Candidatus Cloacimonetes bacterium]|nr:hypothetical protein [Candidatus Cloacimonadota bacterium]
MKELRESLGLDKLFALIEAKGELAASIKRHKLARQHVKLTELAAEYRHCSLFIELITQNKPTKAKLEDIFSHFQELALSQIKQADCLQLHELFELKNFLWQYQQMCAVLKEHALETLHPMPNLSALFKLLDPDGNGLPTFRISPKYSLPLAKLLDLQLNSSRHLQEERQRDLVAARQALDMSKLKEEFVLSRNRQEELAKLLATKHFIVFNENLANYSFRLADSANALAIKQELKAIKGTITEEEANILQKLSKQIKAHFKDLETAYTSAGELSWDFYLAEFAHKYSCCIPKLLADDIPFPGIKLKAAVNLPLWLYLEANNRSYQALDIRLEKATNLITGPNMGGKSTALITLGQLCYLASKGIPLPAQKAELPVYDNIYYNHTSTDNSENLSSFGREVVAFNAALQRKGKTLMLLDEFAKGTNPAEGEALCSAVIEYLSSTEHTLVATTHFSAPAKLDGISHFSIKGIAEKDFSSLQKLPEADMKSRLKLLSEAMDYALVPIRGTSQPPQCAVKIATILGLAPEILELLGDEDE